LKAKHDVRDATCRKNGDRLFRRHGLADRRRCARRRRTRLLDLGQGFGKFGRGGEPIDGSAGESARRHFIDGFRDIPHSANLGDGSDETLRDDRLRVWPGERGLAAEHLVEYAAKAIQVASAVEVCLTGSLFGTHISRCSEHHTGLSDLGFRFGERLPNTEIGNGRRTFMK
jgi:hypothetical protein